MLYKKRNYFYLIIGKKFLDYPPPINRHQIAIFKKY